MWVWLNLKPHPNGSLKSGPAKTVVPAVVAATPLDKGIAGCWRVVFTLLSTMSYTMAFPASKFNEFAI